MLKEVLDKVEREPALMMRAISSLFVAFFHSFKEEISCTCTYAWIYHSYKVIVYTYSL